MLVRTVARYALAFLRVTPILGRALHRTSPTIGSISAGPTRGEFPKFHVHDCGDGLVLANHARASGTIRRLYRWHPLTELGKAMARADEYRRYAAECVRVAQSTSNPNDKQMMLEMAQKWRELAEKVARQNEPRKD
jgi:hypothetical protein